MMNTNLPHNDLDGRPSAMSTAPLQSSLEGVVRSAETLAHQAAASTRSQATHLMDVGTERIRQHPLQSVLVAAGAGAVILLLLEVALRVGRASR
jgi:ElaB/YqjD/DUF883 family membrane-anchored ribosome-binding protein